MSGPFGSSQWMYNPSTSFYPHTIDQSLRFEDGDSAYLYKTYGSSAGGDTSTWTFSVWLKIADVSAQKVIWSGSAAGAGYATNLFYIQLRGDSQSNRLDITWRQNSSTTRGMSTNRAFRDPSAWMHIVLACDTTQATASNRLRLYINGTEETSFSTDNRSTISQSSALPINANSYDHAIGRSSYSASAYFDGYMAEINFVDGSQLAPTSFGETKAGIWIPKDYTGSHGTTGFYLPFDDSSALGDDESANTNDWTSSGLAATDVVLDSPTNNWATMNPLNGDGGTTWKEGALELSTANMGNNASTFLMESGKWYWEAIGTYPGYVGAVCAFDRGTYNNTISISGSDSIGYYSTGDVYWGTGSNSTPATYGATDIIGVAVNMDDGEISFYKNNSLEITLAFSSTISRLATEGCYACYNNGSTSTTKEFNVNFGQDSSFAGNKTAQGNTDDNGNGDFFYSPPSGFLCLASVSLPDPSIDPAQDEEPADYFETTLWTGNGSSQSISSLSFQPDWVWIKNRSSALHHRLFDSIRGANETLFSSTSDAEYTDNDQLMSFDNDGFTLGSDTGVNKSSDSIVGWSWLAGGSASSNTDGSITSSVSANTEAGFSVLTYTGTGSTATVGHGLNSAPDFIIVKSRDNSRNWRVYNSISGATKYLGLNKTDAQADSDAFWNDTEPTSSVFTVKTATTVNGSSEDYVAYCFHSVDGYSKLGTYTGNGSSDGTFVYTGFRPAWLMIKSYDQTRNWTIFDNKRTPFNLMDGHLHANASVAEQTGEDEIDFLSNGFKFRSGDADSNYSNFNYIYLAFADQPFKYSNAR